jgi:hypothetical protein
MCSSGAWLIKPERDEDHGIRDGGGHLLHTLLLHLLLAMAEAQRYVLCSGERVLGCIS